MRVGGATQVESTVRLLEFCEFGEDFGLGQDLREDCRLGVAGGVEDVEGDAFMGMFAQESGDGGVAAGPVALEVGHAVVAEGLVDGGGGEGDAFVDQA